MHYIWHFANWDNIAIKVAVFLLHQKYGEQYLAQIIRFYEGNPLQLFCKMFVWLFLFLDTQEEWDQPRQQTEKSIYWGELVKCQSIFNLEIGSQPVLWFFFQCKELADGKYQSKVLEEGTSKDFGSQDKSFPEDTFWINLVRSSQQTFLWRYSPKENLQKALLMLLKKWKDESFSVFCLTGLKVHPTPQQKL